MGRSYKYGEGPSLCLSEGENVVYCRMYVVEDVESGVEVVCEGLLM